MTFRKWIKFISYAYSTRDKVSFTYFTGSKFIPPGILKSTSESIISTQSQIDAEAEFNRDPALVRQYFFFVAFTVITSLILYVALVATTDAQDADQFLKALENEKRDVLVPYAKKKIEAEIAKKQSS